MNNKRNKILHIIFALNIGGSETMLVDIINEQVKTNHAISLLIVNNEYNAELINEIDKKVEIKFINREKNSRNILPILLLNLYILKVRPNVIHFHDANGIAGIFFSKALKVLTLHSVNRPIKYLKKYDILCAISNTVKSDIYIRSGLDSHLIYNGIKCSKIVSNNSERKNKQGFKIIQIGRLFDHVKGQEVLIKAVQIIKINCPEYQIKVDFIGEGESYDYLNNLVKECKLEKEIRFLGSKNRDFIYKELHKYNLLVQPSRHEGFGLTVVEAMAAKIPVLVSAIDGPMEIIENGKYGYYFEMGNEKECAEKIIEITDDPNLKNLTENAYEHAIINFDIERTAKEYLSLYENHLHK